ncbi:MAG: AsmA-like C-terminal region-containing protein [Pseudomonadota bacterium]
MATENGALQLNLSWPGGPQDFSMAAGAGSLVVDIGSGNFPEVSGGTSGALRVVSILNLTEIVQRLSLTHMFDSGVPFDTVNGEMFLQNGVIEVPKMNVEGGGSSFQFSGASDIASRTLSGELVVTLPVASNLPWVAALTAGLPVAAGVYVLSKVFESQVNRLSSAVYTAGGTWDDPEVSFDRVFDDTAVSAVMPRDPTVSGTIQNLPEASGSQSPPSQGSRPIP